MHFRPSLTDIRYSWLKWTSRQTKQTWHRCLLMPSSPRVALQVLSHGNRGEEASQSRMSAFPLFSSSRLHDSASGPAISWQPRLLQIQVLVGEGDVWQATVYPVPRCAKPSMGNSGSIKIAACHGMSPLCTGQPKQPYILDMFLVFGQQFRGRQDAAPVVPCVAAGKRGATARCALLDKTKHQAHILSL